MESNDINLILNAIEKNIYFTPEIKINRLIEIKKISKNMNYFYGEIKSNILLAKIEYLRKNFEKSLDILVKSEEKISKNSDIILTVEITKEFGILYFYMKDYRLSLEYYLKALGLSKKYNDENIRWKILNNIGVLFNEIGDFKSAKERYLQALSEYNNSHSKMNRILLINIGEVYKNLKEYKVSKNYYNLIKDEISFSKLKTTHFLNIVVNLSLADIYYKIGETQKALKLYENWTSVLMKSENYSLYPKFLLFYSDFILDYKNELNLEYLRLGLKYSKSNMEYEKESKFLKLLGKYYENNNLKKSNMYYKKAIEINEGIIKKLNEKKTVALNKYQVIKEKDEKYNKLIKNTKRLEKISQIGLNFMKNLSLEKIYDLTYRVFNENIEFDKLGIGLYNPSNNTIQYDFFMSGNERLVIPKINLVYGKNLASFVLRKRSPIRINSYSKEYKNYIKNSITEDTVFNQESIIYIPIYFNNNIIGTLTIQSIKSYAFSKEDFDYIKALSIYMTVALNNAIKNKKLEDTNERLSTKTQIDFSTNLYNKRGFHEIANNEIARAIRTKSSIVLVIIDIDYFKEFNDYYGHVKGDKILKQFADLLQKVFKRSIDFVSRFGGDEFVVILSNMNYGGIKILLNNLMEEIKKVNIKHERSPYGRITSSIGVVMDFPDENKTVEFLLDKADTALYKVKNNRRNDYNIINLCKEVN